MSFDKWMGKERRKPYYRSKQFDRSCRPNGGCPWCARDRQIQILRELERVEEAMKDYVGALE